MSFIGVDWGLYEQLLGNGMHSVNRRDVVISDAVQSFVSGMVDDPAYQNSSVVEGEITPLVASRTSTLECAVKAAPGTDLRIGDMVECFGEHWIVVDLYVDKVGIINAVMWMCNHLIKFQNGSSSVHARHCVVDDGTYSKKSTDPDAYIMSNTYKVYMTIDEETRRLYVDKRLSFGTIVSSFGEDILEVYKIVGIDGISRNFGDGSHLLVMTVQRDVYDAETDSISDGICNIYKEETSTAAPVTTGSCAISGRDSVRLGMSRKYTVAFTDAGGNSVDAKALWTVAAPDGVTHVCDGNECAITVPLKYNLVGEEIVISVTNEDGSFGEYTKKVQVITID